MGSQWVTYRVIIIGLMAICHLNATTRISQQAFTAFNGGNLVQMKNPASAASLSQSQWLTQYHTGYGVIKTSTLGWGRPIGETMGVSVEWPTTVISDISHRDDAGNALGTYSDIAVDPIMRWAKRWGRVSVGSAIRTHYQRILNETGRGIDIDVGALVTLSELTIGVSVGNLVSRTKWTTGKHDLRHRVGHLGVAFPLRDMEVMTDVDWVFSAESIAINTAVLIPLHYRIHVIMGVNDLTQTRHLTQHIRLMLSSSFYIDYTYAAHAALGGSHAVGVRVSL